MKSLYIFFIYFIIFHVISSKKKRLVNGLHEFNIFLDTETINRDE